MRGNYEEAAEFYEAALERESRERQRPSSASPSVQQVRGSFRRRVPLYERAARARAETMPEHLARLRRVFHRPSLRWRSRPEARRQFLVEARRRFARSYQLDPKNPETLTQNGMTYLFEGEDVAKGVQSLERAHELLPSQPTFSLLWRRRTSPRSIRNARAIARTVARDEARGPCRANREAIAELPPVAASRRRPKASRSRGSMTSRSAFALGAVALYRSSHRWLPRRKGTRCRGERRSASRWPSMMKVR